MGGGTKAFQDFSGTTQTQWSKMESPWIAGGWLWVKLQAVVLLPDRSPYCPSSISLFIEWPLHLMNPATCVVVSCSNCPVMGLHLSFVHRKEQETSSVG